MAVFGKVNITVRLCPSQRISLHGWFSCSKYAARYTSVVVISVMVLSFSFFLIWKGATATMRNGALVPFIFSLSSRSFTAKFGDFGLFVFLWLLFKSFPSF